MDSKAQAMRVKTAMIRKVAACMAKCNGEQMALYKQIDDFMPHLTKWPSAMMQLFVLGTNDTGMLTFADRFKLTTFLLANWLSPTKIAQWYLTRGMLRDKSARDHVADIFASHISGKLEVQCVTAYVIDAVSQNGNPAPFKDKFRVLEKPNFPATQTGYWAEAIAWLKGDMNFTCQFSDVIAHPLIRRRDVVRDVVRVQYMPDPKPPMYHPIEYE